MNFLKKLFNRRSSDESKSPDLDSKTMDAVTTPMSKSEIYQLYDPNHPAGQFIKEAIDIADQQIEIKFVSGSLAYSTTYNCGMEIIEKIDKALEIMPNDPNLLYAKAAANFLNFDNKQAMDLLDKVLSIDPNHFDARMKKQNFKNWDTLFSYPSWSENKIVLHSVMLDILREGQATQIVRDGLQTGFAIVIPIQGNGFPHQILRSCLKVIWSDTPYGPVVALYPIIDCGSGDIRKKEFFASPYLASKMPHPRHNHWLLRRLNYVDSCFLVASDGTQVLYKNAMYFLNSFEKSCQKLKTTFLQ